MINFSKAFEALVNKYTSTSSIHSYANAAGLGVVNGVLYINTGSGATQIGGTNQAGNTVNVGAVNGATVSAVEYGDGFFHRTVLTLTATPVTVTDSAPQVAGGGTKIYDFPAGAITFLGGSFSVAPTTTSTIASTLKSGVTIEIGLGTVIGAGALTTTEDNIIDGATGPSSTVINVAAAAIAGAKSSAPSIAGTAGSPADMLINIGVPTATDIDADATVTLTGTVTILWAFNG